MLFNVQAIVFLCDVAYLCIKYACMKELRCPHCGNVFQVDDEMFESIAAQVRNVSFQEEVNRREEEIRKQVSADFNLRLIKETESHKERYNALMLSISERDAEIDKLNTRLEASDKSKKLEIEGELMKERSRHQLELSERDRFISDLKAEMSKAESDRKAAVLEERGNASELLRKKDAEIAELRNRMESEKREASASLAAMKEQHALVVSEKDKEIQYHKDFKLRMSTKMLGETLEIHCNTLFQQAQSMGMFPEAYFEKDNDARTGSKGDFIFRDYVDGEEYISIMFEMKNEADATVQKHRNDDFLEKLDRDRNAKGCEYAVLVSMLERDSELYNEGIVNKSYKYPKMYVIRPQMFMNLIGILCQASRKSLGTIRSLEAQLATARAQSVDISKFEERRDEFAMTFRKLVDAHRKKNDDALGSIDKVIESLEKQVQSLKKVKSLFEASEQKLVRANDVVENDFTIKKLTRGNPTMKKAFEEIRRQKSLE